MSVALPLALLADLNSWSEGVSQRLAEALAGSSAPLQVAIFFVGGVLVSLTPCVYPMIPIVVAYMGGAETAAAAGAPGAAADRSARRRRIVLRALTYVLGMSVVYTGLGLAAALLGNTFGASTQTFWAYSFVGLVLVVFGLSLVGLFEIRVPSFIMDRVGGAGRQGFFGAFVMGATSGIVAAPCAAPLVFPLLALVGRDGRVVFGTVGMFAFSLGLGLLFLLLGIFSGLAASLPRPGGWMVRLKQVVGVVVILLGGYFFYLGWLRL